MIYKVYQHDDHQCIGKFHSYEKYCIFIEYQKAMYPYTSYDTEKILEDDDLYGEMVLDFERNHSAAERFLKAVSRTTSWAYNAVVSTYPSLFSKLQSLGKNKQ